MFRLLGGTLLALISFLPAWAGEPWTTRPLGLAGIGVALPSDPGSLVLNPAAIASAHTMQACVSLNPGSFGMSELRSKAVVALVPLTGASVGVGIRRFGFDLYNETSLIAGTAARVEESFDLGLSVELRNISIHKYGSHILPLVTIGMQCRISEDIVVGGRIANIHGASLGQNGERLPRVVVIGLSYLPVPGFRASAEGEKDTRWPVNVKCGVELQIVSLLWLRAGIASDPSVWAVGGTLRSSLAEFSYGGSFHPVLGWTHSVELGFGVPE